MLQILPFVLLLVISAIIGFRVSKKSKEDESYFLGKRSLNWFLLAMTFVGTQIGGGFILGTAEAAYREGLYGIFYSIGLGIGFLMLGLGLGARIRSLEISTAADVFYRFYNSVFLKKYASLLSILSLTGILIAMAISLKKFLISIGFPSELFFIVCWAVVIAYTTKGGLLAVVWTDTVQAIVMMGTLLVAFCFVLAAEPVLSVDFAISITEQNLRPGLASFLIMPLLFMFIEQDMVQRCSAARSEKQVTIATFFSSAILFGFAIIPLYFGVLAKKLGIEPGLGSVFIEVIKNTTNPIVTACASLSVLLAIISTASSLLLAVSSNISLDFSTHTSDTSLIKARTTTALIGICALAVSYLADDILPCLIISYELAVDCLFIPLLAAIIFKDKIKGYKEAAFLSVLLGTLGFALEKSSSLLNPNYFIPLQLSLAGYVVGVWISKRIYKLKI